MSLFRRLFGPKEPPPPARDVHALAMSLAVPALHVVKAGGESASHIGGMPPWPDGVAWPAKGGAPLTFLACIDLASVQTALPVSWLPETGRLLFFYDVENQPWGFDPKDRGSWVVTLATAGATTFAPSTGALPRQPVEFRSIESCPSWQRPEVTALQLTETESELLIEAAAATFGSAPHHQIGGFPDPIQGDEMELECQLVSNGLYCGDSSGYLSPAAKPLRAGATDWRLLLQLDSDDDLGVMWGDGGILYFWVREEDARAGRFDRSWAVLQCY